MNSVFNLPELSEEIRCSLRPGEFLFRRARLFVVPRRIRELCIFLIKFVPFEIPLSRDPQDLLFCGEL